VTARTWIVERDVLAIHDRLLALDGGAPGLLYEGLLASALARPQRHDADGDTFAAPQALTTPAVLDLAAGRSRLEGYEHFLRDHAQPARDP
jgi:hypothetical protein